ncbi:MAG: hypothetical protein MJ137_01870 [Clostridia bacterium]|nr:hypothetical protein [Clostridia bacterium]
MSFGNTEKAIAAAAELHPGLFVADIGCTVEPSLLPPDTVFAEFSENPADAGKGKINRYSGSDAILRRMISMALGRRTEERKDNEGKGKLVVFSSPCGGSGSSVLAEAYAVRCAKKTGGEEKNGVALLNLEACRSRDSLGFSDFPASISELIFAVKSGNMPGGRDLRKYFVRASTAAGIYLTAPPEYSCDVSELEAEEASGLIREMKSFFGTTVVDLPFGFSDFCRSFYSAADRIVSVCDGTEASVRRIADADKALSHIGGIVKDTAPPRLSVIINKSDDAPEDYPECRIFGRIRKYTGNEAMNFRIAAEADFFDYL